MIDVRYRYNDYHNTAAMMMLNGEAAAAVIRRLGTAADGTGYPQQYPYHCRKQAGTADGAADPFASDTAERRAAGNATHEFMRTTDPKRNLLARRLFCRQTWKILADSDMRQIRRRIDEQAGAKERYPPAMPASPPRPAGRSGTGGSDFWWVCWALNMQRSWDQIAAEVWKNACRARSAVQRRAGPGAGIA